MSVESEILRIQHNISNAYTKVAEKGGEVPLQPNSENLPEAISSIPDGSDLTAGDGLSKVGDTLSVDNPNRGILTKAEFEALTPEQKAKGTYFVDDGGGSSGSAGEIYSTEEVRIGIWADGKPLYRKVIILAKGSLESKDISVNIPVYAMDPDIYEIKRLSGTVLALDGAVIPMPLTYVVGNAGTGNNVAYLKGYINVAYSFAPHKNGETNIFVEYTKATDEPVVSTAEIVAAYLEGLHPEDIDALAESAADDLDSESGVTV